MKTLLLSAMILVGSAHTLAAQQPKTWAEQTARLERHDGYVPFYYDDASGKLLFEINRLNQDVLYLTSLSGGLGSNALGLDRGTLGEEAVIRFQKFGNRVFVVRRNLSYRATNGDSAAARAVEQSFASSVLASLPIMAEESGKYLVDATDFMLQDVMNVRGTIQRAQQGTFRLDRNRSAINPPLTKAFPKNTEVDALLTFESDAPGNEVSRNTPDARSLTLREHHSFVELPDNNYKPRAFDPRIGVFASSFYDFSLPLNKDPVVRFASRFRLEKKDPTAVISEPVKPIIYYIDPGVPEPYRTAFKQGAAWWNQAFEAAGFRNAFIVQDLPYDADPLDARYNVVQWVHRSEPGFSVGQSFVDPRTGEIIKAALKMDSYRSLTDYNIFAGMTPAMSRPYDATEFAMARRRQHIAHELGHTLGFAHNYISHAYGRASVMDYPGPLFTLRKDGTVDPSDAYRNGTGSYDTLAIRYAYTQFNSPAEEAAGLDRIVREGLDKGIRFLSDRDADAGLIPEVTRWLNGSDAVAELERLTNVRNVLLAKFDESVIERGDPMFLLNKRLVPVYLHHRYGIEAAVKALGGMEYTFALRGDGQQVTRIIPAAQQRRALTALLATIQPNALAIPERILAKLPPSPYGIGGDEWSFASPAGIAFDPLAVARALAGYVADGMLQPARVERMIEFHARDAAMPSADEVIDAMIASVYTRATASNAYEAGLRRAARRAVVDALLNLAANANATPDVRALAEYKLNRLATTLAAQTAADAMDRAAAAAAVRDIRNWLDKRIAPPRSNGIIQLPPGTPIGS